MTQKWFKQIGWFYLPINAAGFIVTALAILFMIPVIIAVDRNVHSVTDELYEIFVYVTCTAFWWHRVAEKTS